MCNKYLDSQFSKLLDEHLNKKNRLTLDKIADIIGIKRVNLSKYRSGTTLPELRTFPEFLNGFSKALSLTNEEKEKLQRAYYNEKYGAKYDEVHIIGNFFKDLFLYNKDGNLFDVDVFEYNEATILKDKYNIAACIENTLKREIKKEEPKLSIYFNGKSKDLNTILHKFCKLKKLKVRQIFCLSEDPAFNSDLLLSVIPLIFANLNFLPYDIYYFYGKQIPGFMPNMLICSDEMIFISPDFESALLCKDITTVRYFDTLFNSSLKSQEKLKENTPDRENVYTMAIKRFEGIKSCEICGIFAEEGLKYFVETGITLDLPIQYAEIFDISERLYLLKALKDDIKSGKRKEYMTKTLSLPKDIFICIDDHKICFTKICTGDSETTLYYVIINEKSIYQAFKNFIKYGAYTTEYLYNQEETLASIDNYIKLLENLSV